MRMSLYRKLNPELLAWPAGLLCLFFLDPAANHPSLCLLKNVGIPFCPGCGLGHGVHYLLHGQWREAVHHHWLAPVVVATLLYRTFQLARQQYTDFKLQ
ncbi:DUF2752 domain-containing protein [Chitinophaga sp. HK235]|uniref:DUF2752 domain-containing protein n=1 Tax=Chitinophaga sp. HK235 TaxID=2952571 RepID=UPI001BABD84B|nr:DUF2752 domain-containing protein [Chitinophaga sp. HK235]